MKWKCPTVVKQENINQLRNLSLGLGGHGVTGFAAFEAVQEGEKGGRLSLPKLPPGLVFFLCLCLCFYVIMKCFAFLVTGLLMPGEE